MEMLKQETRERKTEEPWDDRIRERTEQDRQKRRENF